MRARHAPAVLALALAGGSLGGCIAAAIPLAAAGAMARGPIDRAAPERPAATAGAPATTTVTAALAEAGAAQFGGVAVLTDLTALPPPSPDPAELRRDEVVRFSVYALQQAGLDPGTGDGPREALLAEPGTLRPARRDCGTRAPAVVIDLDPGRGTFDPLAEPRAPVALGPALASLRAQGIAVGWQSRLGENFAELVAAALAQTGLDPQGADRLLLARSLDERKQSLREEFAETHCVVAMLGDERADFDELFLYLRHADAAVGLEPMLQQGWFITDSIF